MPTYTTKPPVPVDALRLTEDIGALKMCMWLLDSVEVSNITDDTSIGRDVMWETICRVRSFQQYAERKMRKDYLAPTKKLLNKTKRKVSN